MAGDHKIDAEHRLAQILAWKPPAWATVLIGLALIVGAWWLIYSELREHSIGDIFAAVLSVRMRLIILAGAYVCLSFLSLILDEWLSLRLMNQPRPFLAMFAPAYTTYALANALSFSFATAPAVRTRLYRNMLGGIQIGTLSAVTGASVFVGATTTTGLGFLFGAEDIAHLLNVTPLLIQAIGAALLIPAAAWIMQSFGPRHSLSFMGISITTPGSIRAAAQLIVAIAGWMFAAAVLYELLPAHGGWTFLPFCAAFVIACYVGAASGAPAGIGVFDAAILSISITAEHAPATAAALIVYRLIYTLAPLLLGAFILGQDLLRPHEERPSQP